MLRFLFPVLLLITACQRESSPPASSQAFTSIYHWRSDVGISKSLQSWADSLVDGAIYLKIGDIDIEFQSKDPKVVAPVEGDFSWLSTKRVVPVLFITNRSFQPSNYKEGLVEDLIWHTWERILSKLPKDVVVGGFQLDCDWSGSTRQSYFALLERVRKRLYEQHNLPLSVTLRLHQLRDPANTGVPPVDRVTLMLYNVGDVSDPAEINSILRIDRVGDYLQGTDTYALPMDIALPLFSWLVVYRYGELVDLIPEADRNLLQDTTVFQTHANHRFKVLRETYLSESLLYPQDELRLEAVDLEELRSVLDMIYDYQPEFSGEILFFHLEDNIARHYSADTLRTLIRNFRHK